MAKSGDLRLKVSCSCFHVSGRGEVERGERGPNAAFYFLAIRHDKFAGGNSFLLGFMTSMKSLTYLRWPLSMQCGPLFLEDAHVQQVLPVSFHPVSPSFRSFVLEPPVQGREQD